MAEWFLRLGNESLGPYTSKQFTEFASDGRLIPTDSIRRGDMAGWVPAAKLQGLTFPPELPPPPVEAVASVTPPQTPLPLPEAVAEQRPMTLAGVLALLRRRPSYVVLGSLLIVSVVTVQSPIVAVGTRSGETGGLLRLSGSAPDMSLFVQAIRTSMKKMPRFEEGSRLCACRTQRWDDAKPMPYLMNSGRLIVLDGSETLTLVFPLTTEGRLAFSSAIASVDLSSEEREQLQSLAYSNLNKKRQVGRFKFSLQEARGDDYFPIRGHALPGNWVRIDVDRIDAARDQIQHLYWVYASPRLNADPHYGQLMADLRHMVAKLDEEDLLVVVAATDTAGLTVSHAREIFQQAAGEARQNGLLPKSIVEIGLSGVYTFAALAGVAMEEWRDRGK